MIALIIAGIVIGCVGVRVLMPSTHLHPGEKVVKKKLATLRHSRARSCHGLLLKVGKGFTEIDHVVVGHHCMVVIETKYAHGSIHGDVNQAFWRQEIGSKTHDLRNPIAQNQKHIAILAKQLNMPQASFKNLIVFPDETQIMINDSRLVRVETLKEALNELGVNRSLNQKDKEIYRKLKTLNHGSIINRWRHQRQVRAKQRHT